MKATAVAILCLLVAPALAGAESVSKLYKDSCGICHDNGAAGAPRKGDSADWKPRLQKGMETLVKHVREGYRGMPPKGMCNQCTDEDFRALIKYMTQ